MVRIASRSSSSSSELCNVCFAPTSGSRQRAMVDLRMCVHKCCLTCAARHIELAINESRVPCKCWECDVHIHPNDVHEILDMATPDVDGRHLIEKYEQFSVRRALIVDPDTRWCPAPDCKYACIASNCAACPALDCELCSTQFCYHCKAEWHDKQTCEQAREARGTFSLQDMPATDGDWPVRPGDIRACPRCRTYIAKLDDGSCNHMTCGWCGVDFCWLCLKEVSDLHYLSPSGCTFWGRQRWSRKKVVLWQFGTLIGAPVGIALIAALALPAIIFGVPILAARKTNARLTDHDFLRPCHRRLLVVLTTLAAALIAPLLAVIAVGIGVPLLLAYVYGVVPYSLCRQGVCRGGASDDDDVGMVPARNDIMNTFQAITRQVNETESMRLLSHIGMGRGPTTMAATTTLNTSTEATVVHIGDSTSTTEMDTSRTSRRDASAYVGRACRASSTASRETTNVTTQSLAVHYADVHSQGSSKQRQRRRSNESSTTTATGVSQQPNYDAASTSAVHSSMVTHKAEVDTIDCEAQTTAAASSSSTSKAERHGSEFVMIGPEALWMMQQTHKEVETRQPQRWSSVSALVEQTSRYMGDEQLNEYWNNVFNRDDGAAASTSHRHSVQYPSSTHRSVIVREALHDEEEPLASSVSYASLPSGHDSVKFVRVVLRKSQSSITEEGAGDHSDSK